MAVGGSLMRFPVVIHKDVNITVPERVLAIVDKMAAREGESRSAFLARAALSYADRQSSR